MCWLKLLKVVEAVVAVAIACQGSFSNLLILSFIDTSEEPKAPLRTLKNINGTDAEMVEILI